MAEQARFTYGDQDFHNAHNNTERCQYPFVPDAVKGIQIIGHGDQFLNIVKDRNGR